MHLLTHSFPIVLSLSGAVVGLAGWVAGRADLERWGILALLVGGAFAIPAYLTGLAAADVVSERTFVQPSDIQSHRYGATFALVLLILGGVLAGFAMYEKEDARLRRFVLLIAAIAAAVTGYAAYLGARIEHGTEGDEGANPNERMELTATTPSPGASWREPIP
jgi:uncharacterized membrane protein